MSGFIILSGSASDVTIAGLKNSQNVTQAAFDGITVTLSGAEVNNFSDLTITSGAAAVNLQFVDKKTALTPRTFTFMEKYSGVKA